MYQVIARKWRPQSFEEVTGQEAITRTLSNAVEHERLHHAYLFSGARGVGKTTTARLLAKALNCHKSDKPTVAPCRMDDETACPSCREIAEGRSIDVQEIDAASNTGVDNVRESIINTVGVRPSRDRYRVFIIDEVHMLSGAAFNALLKTLEEPPPRVAFIMATTEAHKVPDTILSRCQQFQFRTIPARKIFERLRLIADAERVDVDAEALREIARAGAGSMRDAQSAFDQTISFSAGRITTETVETALGIAGSELLMRAIRAIAEERPADALKVVDDIVMRGHDLRNFTRDLMAYLRDLLTVKIGVGDDEEAERRTEKKRLADAFSESDLVRFFHSLTETEKNLRESAHPRYQLEIGLVKLIEMRRLAPLTEIIERLHALEELARTGTAPTGKTPSPSTTHNSLRGVGGSTVARASEPPFTTATKKGAAGSGSFKAELNDKDARSESNDFLETSLAAHNSTGTLSSAAAVQRAPQPANLKLVASPSQDTESGSLPHDNTRSEAASIETPALIERIKSSLEDRRRPFLAIALDGASEVQFDDGKLLVNFPPASKHLRENLARPDNLKILREVCAEILGRDVNLSLTVGNSPAKKNEPPAEQLEAEQEKARLREIAERNPVIQQMKKLFRAEIIDVQRVEEQTET
jgi:DNA polymerase III subunit gamma/tau